MSTLTTFSLADKPNRLASIKFLTGQVARGGFTITTFPVHFGDIFHGPDRKKASTIAGFLQDLPFPEREAWLRARDSRWGHWLDTGSET